MNICSLADQIALIEIVSEAMELVKCNQGGHLPDDSRVKGDKTLVTRVDKLVRAHIDSRLRASFGKVRIGGEDGTNSGSGNIIYLIDPVDGTRALSCGLATSTVILGVYDSFKHEVIGCAVGEAATGRIWSAFGDEPTKLNGREVKVWKGRLDEQSTVFLDVPHGFTRENRKIFTHNEMMRLIGKLNSNTKGPAIPGSNGLIQALVANGGEKAVGSITTAIGGPWDVCGVKLVLNAGGTAMAFRVEHGVDPEPCLLDAEPLDVLSYDVLVCGNSQESVNSLTEMLPALCASDHYTRYGRGWGQL